MNLKKRLFRKANDKDVYGTQNMTTILWPDWIAIFSQCYHGILNYLFKNNKSLKKIP